MAASAYMLLVTAHPEVAAVAIACDLLSPAQCREPVHASCWHTHPVL